MPTPDFQACMRPLLNSISNGQVSSFNDAYEAVCEHFDVTPEEKAERLPSGKQTKIRNRCGWARTYLKKAKLLTQPERGLIQITPLGLVALQQRSDRIDVKYLKTISPEFVEFHTSKSKSSDTLLTSVKDDTDALSDPTERLEQAHQELQTSLADDLLEQIKQQTPEFFEKLVVELMLAMGYGGWSEQAGQATQYTNDGGIDGIINEDPLGLDTIYLQAKRYTDNAVGRPDIQAFVGALEMKRSRKGVFITTSRFSRDAVDYVNMIEKRVVLIDGTQLAELMIRHNLGVTVKETYYIKDIDTDYFSDN